MELERRGDVLVVRVGVGEWYNQPDRGLWDMGEDVQPLPPAAWRAALLGALDGADPPPRAVVVDTTETHDLVGHDWGFLVKLGKILHGSQQALVLVGHENTCRVAKLFGIEDLLRPCSSLQAALELLQTDRGGGA